jgi:hypothetical protein
VKGNAIIAEPSQAADVSEAAFDPGLFDHFLSSE